ncbi:energy-coupling factor ABC transporter ATP-binding protein [Fictibacillus sp. KIGAM418]|uniref:Energy-coupling factor transporter ATP-binding protein EcfA2 n=1 Tax=Fictibacillus marinisediminis TaxID=2878389 RepID=A0A9X2BBA2_9BACL|nr:energy-coupling factor ABC transporter ATP-binding protein [Fictibacillus marinisediminis]MCK6255221.1 energy-coupling factor ABC transporter ATP-binding protein [Fictibacillus marinisediminis]
MDIKINNLTHRYKPGTPFERLALKDVNLSIPSGSFLAVIGHTGSGKSTLIQHLNGLLKPSEGTIQVGDLTIAANEKKKQLKALRKRVGIVFQYPEHQLFDETVEKDVMFGPMNFGQSEEAARKTAREMVKLVGLPDEVLQKSPFDLSGGQMRRVAIAGVLAMQPEVLILDEPTAGLDPKGRKEIMDLFRALHDQRKTTTILVTHSMEDAAYYADHIVVMDKGSTYLEGTPAEIFDKRDELQAVGLDVPETVQFLLKWQELTSNPMKLSSFTIEETAKAIAADFGKGGSTC